MPKMNKTKWPKFKVKKLEGITRTIDIDVYFAKRKNGQYIKENLCVYDEHKTPRKTIKEVMMRTIEKKKKQGRYYDWGFLT